jgi:iron complex outermembrane receptor protein
LQGETLHAQAQRDTSLNEVNIRAKHNISNDTKLNDFSPGQKIKTIDSVTLQQYKLQSLSNLLTQQVPVFIKSYGFNGLATLNFRGASAAQSAVYWNGVPIQNAALGIADVSTLPVLFMNKVNIVFGGSSALWGSGNVGGALILETGAPVFDSGKKDLTVSGGIGSFHQYMGGLKGSMSTRRWYLAANLFGQSALNDFRYNNNSGDSKRIANSQLQSGAALVQAAYKIADNHTLGFSAWYQRYDRQIPETLTDLYSVKKQQDASLRLLASWNKQDDKNILYARASLIRDDIDYSDSALAIHSVYTVHQYFHEVGWKRRVGDNGQLMIFSPVQLSWIELLSGERKTQSKVALAAVYEHKLFNDKLDVAVNAREEVINDLSVFLPGANGSFAITDWFSIRANAQRTYRTPTLNELYYFPGGNRNLRPEQGWNEDAGYTAKGQLNSWRVYHDLSVFNRNIHDWIIWLGNAVWTPYNIAEVHSRGIETDNSVVYNSNKWQAHISVNTSYVLATTVSSYMLNDGSIGKQIPYTPRYNARLNVGFTYRQLYVNYNHTYTGYRFFTTDETGFLPPYQTGNIQLMYTAKVARRLAQFTAQCNNIWNEHYQVVANRPMPGVNWQAGFSLQLF